MMRAPRAVGSVFRSTRTTVAEGFSNPVELPQLSVFSQVIPTLVSPDDCVLYLTVTAPGPQYKIYVAQRGS